MLWIVPFPLKSARPSVDQRRIEAIQGYFTEMPLVDAHNLKPLAVSMSWKRFELARTAIVAVAIGVFVPLDVPIHLRDHIPLGHFLDRQVLANRP